MRTATQFLACWLLAASIASAQMIDLGSAGGWRVIDGHVAGARAGAYLHIGDLTGDFWNKEFIVSAPDEDSGRGAVRVFIGGPRTLVDMTTASADAVFIGETAGDRFGAAVDAGYVTNPEVQLVNGNPVGATPPRNLIIGAPGAQGGRGVVYVFPGPVARNSTRPASSAAYRIIGPLAGDHLGSILESVDLNGDGYREVILPVASRGFVYVVDLRAATGSTIDLSVGVPGTIIIGLDNEIAVAAGDLTGDGLLDLAIGDPNAQGTRGAVYFIQARVRTLPGSLMFPAQADAQFVGVDPGDRLGTSVWVADIDDDGDYAAELIAGAPGADAPGNARPDAGEVHVFWGRPNIAAAFAPGLTLYGAAAGHRLGAQVTAGHVTRKTPYDIAMLAPGASGAGEVFVFYGRHSYEFPSSPADLSAVASRRVIGDDATGPIQALRIWEATGEGAEEVLVGVPSASTIAGAQAGRIFAAISPRLELSTGSVNLVAFQCAPAHAEIEVRNPSVIPVPWRLYEPPPWVSIQPATGTSVLGSPGRVKLVTDTSGLAPGIYTHRVEFLSNGPHLGHSAAVNLQLTVTAGSPIASNAHVDLDGDGCADLALFNQATGTWRIPGLPDQQLGSTRDIPVAGDYNGDLRAEIAVFRRSTATWLFADGTVVQYGSPGDLPVPADYDGDGRLDIAVFTPRTATWSVRGQTSEQWGQPGDMPVPADYNGDGRAEFAVYRRSSGTWTIRGGATVVWGGGRELPMPADYDSDGRADIAVFDRPTATWKVKDQFTQPFGTAGDLPAAVDVDRDGRVDLVVWNRRTRTWSAFSRASEVTLTGAGGQSGDMPAFFRTYLLAPPTFDFNGDASMDLLWQHAGDGSLAGWQMNSTTLLRPAVMNPAQISDPNWRIVGTPDFTADGKPDLLWHHQRDGWFAAWEMNGGEMVRALRFTPNQMADLNWQIVGTADFTGDGLPDLLWQHRDGWFAAWEMNGTEFVRALRFEPNRQSDPNWKIVAVEDFTGDFQPDLIWQHTDGWFAAWEMDGVQFVRALLFTPNQQPDTNWKIAAVGDLNGDGQPDFIWHHRTQGWLAAWQMDGTRFVQALSFTPNRLADTSWRLVGPR